MLTLPRLVARNLTYHWRGNLAVLLGVAVGSAVLTGALLVGDSLRGSLRDRAERQLNGIDAAAVFPRPIHASVADGMPGKTAPVLLLQGSIQTVTAGDEADARSIGRVIGPGELEARDVGAVDLLERRVACAGRVGAVSGPVVIGGVEKGNYEEDEKGETHYLTIQGRAAGQ